MPVKDMTGQRFGRLLVIERADNTAAGSARWFCLCECGAMATVTAANLRQGKTKSCGCLNAEMRVENVQAGLRQRWDRQQLVQGRIEADGCRRCLDCEKRKPLIEFGSNCGMRDGKNTRCLACMNERASDYKERNRGAVLQRQRGRYWSDPTAARAVVSRWRDANLDQVRLSQRAQSKRNRELLTDAYVAGSLLYGRVSEIPKGIIEMKREQQILRRLAKELQQAVINSKEKA